MIPFSVRTDYSLSAIIWVTHLDSNLKVFQLLENLIAALTGLFDIASF